MTDCTAVFSLCDLCAGLVLGAGVGLSPRVAHGAGEGGSVVEFPSGKTYREKATPALVEALVYLPQGLPIHRHDQA
jgi:hypothetical protein